jgi:hypothetical protein
VRCCLWLRRPVGGLPAACVAGLVDARACGAGERGSWLPGAGCSCNQIVMKWWRSLDLATRPWSCYLTYPAVHHADAAERAGRRRLQGWKIMRLAPVWCSDRRARPARWRTGAMGLARAPMRTCGVNPCGASLGSQSRRRLHDRHHLHRRRASPARWLPGGARARPLGAKRPRMPLGLQRSRRNAAQPSRLQRGTGDQAAHLASSPPFPRRWRAIPIGRRGPLGACGMGGPR